MTTKKLLVEKIKLSYNELQSNHSTIMKNIPDNKRPKWVFETSCPFCKKVTSTYIDFKNFRRVLTEEEVEGFDKWALDGLNKDIISTPCKHLAFKTDCFENEAHVEDRWRDVLLRLIEYIGPDEYYPFYSANKLDKYLNDYFSENPYELDKELVELLPEYSLKIETIEPKSEYDPHPYDTSFSMLYIKEKPMRKSSKK